MSHLAERKEKDCLNCGTIIHGRFCHVCGQENLEPRESFWHLVTHFFYDITHFDGKFFTTLKDLAFKPGFLSREYMKGRRASYLNPVRMYVFTSAIFFLLFFTFIYSDKGTGITTTINGKTMAAIETMDSASFATFTAELNRRGNEPGDPMTREQFRKFKDSALLTGLHVPGGRYKSRGEYDSALASGAADHGWFQRQLIYKQIDINNKYKNDPNQIGKAFQNTLIHSLPQILFVSLPLLALILKLMYVRRKQFYYVGHGIFSLHLYIFVFIALLVMFGLNALNNYIHWDLITIIVGIMIFGLFVYEYIAMKKFYQQGWFKTFMKFLLTNLLFFFVLCLVFVVFVFLSLFKI